MINIKILNFIRRRHKITATAYSHAGNVRVTNQDNLYVNGEYMNEKDIEKPYFKTNRTTKAVSVFAVSDGMGGESYGEKASLIAVTELKEMNHNFGRDIGEWDNNISEYICRTNDLICGMMRQYKCNSGTTLVLLCTDGRDAKIYNVGDSRVYILRDKELRLLTKDHTIVQQLVDANCLSANEAKTYPGRHKLTQNLGIFPQERSIEPYIHPIVELKKGDIFLLCSDGVTEMCDNDSIREILMQEKDIESMGRKLLEKSLEMGGYDNITMILLSVE